MTTATIGNTATLAHGITMAEVEILTRAAVKRFPRSTDSIDPTDRWDAAWFAIIELIYTTTEKPTGFSLICAGMDAISNEVTKRRSMMGYSRKYGEAASGPNFVTYWMPHPAAGDGFSDRLIERLALPKVMAELTAEEYEVIAALAIFGTQIAAAEALGLKYGTFTNRLHKARARAQQLWFEHETPRTSSKVDLAVTCKVGHARDEHTVTRPTGERYCGACAKAAERRRSARKR
ncbi:hypothetical protein GCM10023340_36380 [Nocardioides marinquilinus]|uniref:Sigma-70 family RNA polymerase sigma factor n=1 Tax=Nocardioides marinquilinus TaxID=1210400 RepID=A0ABP9PZ02_9ACTN